MDFGICHDAWSSPEYSHLDIEQHDKLEDNVDIKLGDTWNRRHQKRNLSRRLVITITDSKGHKSWLQTRERRMQDQSPAIYG